MNFQDNVGILFELRFILFAVFTLCLQTSNLLSSIEGIRFFFYCERKAFLNILIVISTKLHIQEGERHVKM